MAEEVLKDLNQPTPGEAPGLTPEDISNTDAALDKLLKEAEGGDEPKPKDDPAPPAPKADEPKPKDDPAPPAPKADEPKPKDDPAPPAPKADEPKPKDDPAPPAPKADEPKPKDDPAPPAPVPKTADDFDKVELPPYSKPKSVEAFDKVKEIARQKIRTAEETLAKVQRDFEEFKAKTPEGLPPEVEKELRELRQFRQGLDVEADPKFKEWVSERTKNDEAIYTKLRSAQVSEDAIAKIKELGGPAEVDWEPIIGKLPVSVRTYIEGKLFQNEELKEKSEAALAEAKKNSESYLKNRQAELAKQTGAQKQEVEKEVTALLPQLNWMVEKTAAKDATPEVKAEVERHNKLVSEAKQDIKEALEDDSAATRAILILGFAQLRQVRSDFESYKASAKAKEAALQATIEKHEAFIKKVKGSSTSRLRDSVAPNTDDGGKPDQKLSDPNIAPGDALDGHLKAIQAQQ